jgi:hypothetical protein
VCGESGGVKKMKIETKVMTDCVVVCGEGGDENRNSEEVSKRKCLWGCLLFKKNKN